MRGESGSTGENVRGSAAKLLQRDTLKVVNMIDLARELSGEVETPVPVESPAHLAEFWKHRFENWRSATPLIVTVPPQSGAAARKPAHFCLTLSESVCDRLRTFADQVGIPFGVLFQATWALLLHRYSGEDDVVFGMVKGCIERDIPEAEPGVHIVPSRVVFEPGARVRPWLRAIADQAKETAPFEFISLDQIRSAAGIPATSAMFESVLSIGHDLFDPLTVATAQPQASQFKAGADTYPLVAAIYFGREIALRIAYSPQKFSETAIKLLLGHWSTLLGSLCERAEELVASVPMLGAAEREQLVHRWNATKAAWPVGSPGTELEFAL